MDINIDDFLYGIYVCFVLYNFCEINNERIGEDKVIIVINYDRSF